MNKLIERLKVASRGGGGSVGYMEDAIKALEAADRMVAFTGHYDDCKMVIGGVWTDPTPCSCGFDESYQTYRAATQEDI